MSHPYPASPRLTDQALAMIDESAPYDVEAPAYWTAQPLQHAFVADLLRAGPRRALRNLRTARRFVRGQLAAQARAKPRQESP